MVAGSQDLSKLDPSVNDIEEMQEEMLGRPINRLNMKRFTQKELSAWETLIVPQAKDVLEVCK